MHSAVSVFFAHEQSCVYRGIKRYNYNVMDEDLFNHTNQSMNIYQQIYTFFSYLMTSPNRELSDN